MSQINRVVILVIMALLPLPDMGGSRLRQMSSNAISSPAYDAQPQLSSGSEWGKVAAQSDEPTSEPEHEAAQPGKRYVEYTFSNQDGKWVRSWFQCDQTRNIALMLGPVESRTHRYLAFQKYQPRQQTSLELSQQDEVDCGMMKCWWELKPTHEGNATYVVQESHYYNQEDGYWTRNYQIGIGATKEAAASHMQQCRWFPRTRVALLTEQRAIYITETTSGSLEYRRYDYGQTSDQPSLMLMEGVRKSDRDQEMESFTFTNQIYMYIVNVSSQESRPGVQVLVKKKDSVVQEEHYLSYTYLKKY